MSTFKLVNESVNSRLFNKTENSLGRRCSNLMKLYMRLGNIIASTFLKNIGQRLTMRQVVGQIHSDIFYRLLHITAQYAIIRIKKYR